MGETLRELERVRDKGFKILKENLTPVELIEFLQIISNGTGDYTKAMEQEIIQRKNMKVMKN